jgi:hypothetical protein
MAIFGWFTVRNCLKWSGWLNYSLVVCESRSAMNIQIFLVSILALPLAMTAPAMAQDSSPTPQVPAFIRVPHGIHARLSVESQLARLTKDLDLTPAQQPQVLQLLEQHRDKIQALFDANPGLPRDALTPRIHAISDETHREIGALLTEPQKQLVLAMQKRLREGQENREGREN